MHFFTPWHCLALGTGDIHKCQCLLTWHARALREPSKQAWPLVLLCTLLRIYIRSPKLEPRVHSNSKQHHELWHSATVLVVWFPPNELYVVTQNKQHTLGLLSFRNSVSRSCLLSRLVLSALFALSARLSTEEQVRCCPGCDIDMTCIQPLVAALQKWFEAKQMPNYCENSLTQANSQFVPQKPFLLGLIQTVW